MDKVMMNFVPLNGTELPFLRRGGSGGSAGAGGSYNVESIDNGDGTQTLQITDATGGGASGDEMEWEYFVKGENFSSSSMGNITLFPFATLGKIAIPDIGLVDCSMGAMVFFEQIQEVGAPSALGVMISKTIQDFNLMGFFDIPKGTSLTELYEMLGANLDGSLIQISKEEYDALGV